MLQRSVTERRRLASGRPNVSRRTGSDMGGPSRWTAGGIHPHLGSIRPQLLLPHRHAALHLFDHVPACFERLGTVRRRRRSEEHTSELQSPCNLVCRLLLEKKKQPNKTYT